MSIYRDQLEQYLKTLEVKAERVIDVGGGSNPVFTRVKSWNVGLYAVMDNELEKQEFSVPHGQAQNRWQQDFNLPIDPMMMAIDPYDLVFCLELFDYIWDPVQACQNLRSLCEMSGRLIVTFPFVYPNHNPVGFDMLRFTKQGAEKLLYNAGFSTIEIIPRTMGDKASWLELMKNDGYKYRGAHDKGTLYDAGYIFIARPKR